VKKFLILGGILASLVTGANATVEIRIINAAGGGDTGWISPSCTTIGGITQCTTGAITVGNYILTTEITTQHNNTGNPLLDLNYNTTTNVSGAGTIIFEAMADGYTNPLSQVTGTQLQGNGNSPLGDTVNLADFGGNNNTICPLGLNACTPGSITNTLVNLTGLPEPLSVTANGPGASVSPFSLGLVLQLVNPRTTGTATGDIALNAVPEPASVALLGGVMLAAVSAIRRKTRRA
jgi:hypothetical protein